MSNTESEVHVAAIQVICVVLLLDAMQLPFIVVALGVAVVVALRLPEPNDPALSGLLFGPLGMILLHVWM